MECTQSFLALLSEFRCVFTEPSFLIFLNLMTGWVLSHRRRFVTELIWSSGSTRRGHHSRYHRFFSKSAWELDMLAWILAQLLVRLFAPTGIIELAVDDTLCRKRGLTVYGTGMHHDPLISSRAKPLTSWGHDWVVLTLIVRCPFWSPTKVWSLPIAFRLYRLHATLLVKTMQALYYKAGKDRLLTIVLVRDAVGKRPDQMFYCTCLDWDARWILSAYAARWSIEVTFENSKQLLGLEDPANRKEKAVRRTAPMALVLYGLIVAWFHQVGYRHVRFPDRPWYRRKAEPSFADMLTTLRRHSWLDLFRTLPLPSGRVKKQLAQIIEFLSLAG